MNRFLLILVGVTLTACRFEGGDTPHSPLPDPGSPAVFQVSYHLGTPGTPPAPVRVSAGSAWTVSAEIPVLAGSFFAGWKGSDGVTYLPGQGATLGGAGDLALTALWTTYETRALPWTSLTTKGNIAYGWNPTAQEVQSGDLGTPGSSPQPELAVPHPPSALEVASDGTNVWALEVSEYTQTIRLVQGTVAPFSSAGTSMDLSGETSGSGFSVVPTAVPTFWLVGRNTQTFWRLDTTEGGSLSASPGLVWNKISRVGTWGAQWSPSRNQLLVAASSAGEVWGVSGTDTRPVVWASGLGPVQGVAASGSAALVVASDGGGTRVWSLAGPGETPVLVAAWATGDGSTRLAVTAEGKVWVLQKGTGYGFFPNPHLLPS